MARETYGDAVRSFEWSEAHDALGWKAGEKVSLGHSIVDRHVSSGRVALIAVGKDGRARRYSFAELSEASNRFANLLVRLGVRPGDRVAGLMPRGSDVLVTILGTLKAGAIYVPIFTGFGSDAIRFRLTHSAAKILITHHAAVARLPDDITAQVIFVPGPGSSIPSAWLDFHDSLQGQSPVFSPVLSDRSDIAALIYTSGSTGEPKGGAIAVNFLGAIWPYIVYGLDLRREDVFWPTGDPGWGYGFVCYLGALAAGGTVVSVEENPSADLCLSALEQYRVTNLATTPTMLRSLLALSESVLRKANVALRAISSCGEPLNAKVVDAFQNLWKITPMDHFGATEFAIPIGNFNALAMPVKAGSMGRPFPGFRMEIIDEAGRELPAGELGLIGKKSDPDCLYWSKYWDDAAASQALVHDGWIATGDLGRKDSDGYFWFEGRSGDMIKSAGYRIGPFEIESALLKHPAVIEAAVVGTPDELRGEVVKAFVVLRPGMTGSDQMSDELVRLVRDLVGRHQYPRVIEYIDALPKTETGKIQRFALRARC
jgi:acetyl-CoA synthetase